jgi:protocatechuate 3,4-dioxygenase beta subunit
MKRREALRWLGTSSGFVLLSAACGDRAGGGGDDDGVMIDAADGTDALVLPDGAICRATTNDVLGPFHRDGAPSRTMIAAATEPGDRIALDGVVLADDCTTPLVGAALDIWQADATGAYHEPTETGPGAPYRLRGQVAAGGDGTWAIDTIKPGNYMNGPGWRPAHIHFIVTHPGYQTLTTQLYFAGDPYLPPNDSCTTCGSDDPARIIPLVARAAGGFTAQFQIVLARV